MAESNPSTSEKPPIEKLGLGLLITATTPSVPIALNDPVADIQHTDSYQNVADEESDSPAKVVEEGGAADEEVELRNAIERDLFRLTIEQAKIETAIGRSEASDEDKRKDVSTVKNDKLDEEKDGKDAESTEDEQNENEGFNDENEGSVGSKSGDAVTKLYNQSNNGRRFNYPMRPDAEDCTFYMKFGSCKFGLNCKFNHPPRRKNQGFNERVNYREEGSERAWQTECKFYLTSGGCRYGKDCKYFHGSDKNYKSRVPEFNFLGLPIRTGEKDCPYYMRTGSCKYGSDCRFHHPEPSTVVGANSASGYGNDVSLPSQLVSSSSAPSWSSPRAFNEASPFPPVMRPPREARTSNPECNVYQAATYPKSESGLPTPPAFAINNLPTEINLPMPHLHDMVLEEYPERPGEPECSFFLKTGDCKYKFNCKFHHPKNSISKSKTNSFALNYKGLPLRPDQPICTHYYRHGVCKYGPGCKYDHPSNFSISA